MGRFKKLKAMYIQTNLQEILEKAIKDYSGKNPKITFVDEDYQIDKEKGIVRCFLTSKMPVTLFNDREFRIFTGTAQVCGNDTFDEELGKKIARSKAEAKTYKAYTRQFAKLLKPIMEYIVIIDKEMKKEHDNYLNSIYYLDKYSSEE